MLDSVLTSENELEENSDLLSDSINETVFAVVRGSPLLEIPEDLYIPPDALRIFLEAFEGPLDLLLYLIKRQNLDILNIPIAQISKQYISYIEVMKNMQLELAAEYLVMAAMLAEIKSRMLLPRQTSEEEEEEDPRAELIRRLQEYEIIKQAAEDIDGLPRMERDLFSTEVDVSSISTNRPLPDVQLREMLLAMHEVLKRAEQLSHHQIIREPLSVRERMSNILESLRNSDVLKFNELFIKTEGRHGVVVSFLAILELSKEGLIEIIQTEPLSDLFVKTV